MSARTIRRAAERQALKSTRQTNPEATPQTTVSAAQLAANRANAQFSTGAKTVQGKFNSSHNAVKTGLTGRTILLPTDDVSAYLHLVAMINEKLNPATDYERHITQTIADTEWRLLRIPHLEASLYAIGRRDLADKCEDPEVLEATIFRTYQKDLRNLALQERRLRNYLKEDTAELRRIQEARLAKEQEAAEQAQQPTKPEKSARAQENGFEFTTQPQSPQTIANTEPEPTSPGEDTLAFAVAS